MKHLNKTSIVFIFLIILCIMKTSLAQNTGIISGKVTDSNNEALIGANIFIPGLSIGASSDANGNFEIRNVKAGTYKLRASFVGYSTVEKEVVINSGEVTNVSFILEEDLLGLREIVVTGTNNPRTKLESSVAISTLTPKEMENRSPRNTADALSFVPGLWVESTGGEGWANIWVRGFPQEGGYYYAGIMEDGLPVVPTGLRYFSPDQSLKFDQTIERVEAIRGGSAPIILNNSPGLVINNISKTGGAEFEGLAKLEYASQELGRIDLNFGGPINSFWRYNIGGFFRRGNDQRDIGFPNSGGQVKGNLTHFFNNYNGFIRFYGKYLNDKVGWLVPGVYRYTGKGEFESIPQFNLDDAVSNTRDRKYQVVIPAFNGKPEEKFNFDLENGMKAEIGNGGFEFEYNLGNDWILNNKFRYEYLTNSQDYDLLVGLMEINPQAPLFYLDGTPYTNPPIIDGKPYALQFVSLHGDNNLEQVIEQMEINKTVRNHTVRFGLFYHKYWVDYFLLASAGTKEIANQPRRLKQTPFPDDNGYISAIIPDLISKFNGDGSVYSAYISDEWTLSDKLRIDAGARIDYTDLNVDIFDKEYRGDNPSPINNFLPPGSKLPIFYFADTKQNITKDATDWSATLGSNYKVNNVLALFLRGTKSYSTFTMEDLVNPGYDPNKIKSRDVYVGEFGVKVASQKFAIFSSLLYAVVDNARFSTNLPGENGTILPLTTYGSTRTIAAEIEFQARPIRDLNIRLTTTIQNAEYTDYTLSIPVGKGFLNEGTTKSFEGNTAERVPAFTGDLTIGYDLFTGFNIYGNVRYYSERNGDASNIIKLGGFAEFYCGINYQFLKNISASFRVTNLFNTIALTEGNTRGDQVADPNNVINTVRLGRPNLPRNATFSLTYNF